VPACSQFNIAKKAFVTLHEYWIQGRVMACFIFHQGMFTLVIAGPLMLLKIAQQLR